jgi:hypothetical protein
MQIYFDDLVDHVAKPCVTLDLASRPTFVGSKISGSGAYKEERLEEMITKLAKSLGKVEPSTL